MRNILIFLIGILIIVVEGSITNYFQIAGSSINFLLIYMTIISLYLDEMEVGILGALIGFVKDISIGSIFGVNALILATISYSISHLKDKIYKNSLLN